MKKLKLLLSPKELRRLWLLIGVLFVNAILQVIGIVSILPFMSLVAKPELVQTNKWLNKLYILGGFQNERSMLISLFCRRSFFFKENVNSILEPWSRLRNTNFYFGTCFNEKKHCEHN